MGQVIYWLTGYDLKGLQDQIDKKNNFEMFFRQAPKINPNASLIKGVICRYRVEKIGNKLVRNVRYLDKRIDELAKGKAIDKVLRK